jgi:hypothetical protein
MSNQLVQNVEGRLPVGGEFQGHNGDCAEYALMIGRTAKMPVYPCDGATLEYMTNLSIGAGQAGPAGQMTDSNFVWLCRALHLDYAQRPFDPAAVYGALGNGAPVCCGFSNGQALPGNEPGVFGHAICLLDWDGHTFTLANGDSTNGRAGKLDYGVTWEQIWAAQPTTQTSIWGLVMLQISQVAAFYREVDAAHWECIAAGPSQGLVIGMGILYAYRTWPAEGSLSGLTAMGLPLSNEEYPGPAGVAVQRFERGQLNFDGGRALDAPPGAVGNIYAAQVKTAPPASPPVDTAGIIEDQRQIISWANSTISKAGG